MTNAKQLLYSAFYRTGLFRWFGRKRNGAILMLHSVVEAHPAREFHPNRQFMMTKEVFEELLESFVAFGYEFVTLDEVVNRLRTDRMDGKFVCLTFDDGYRDNLEIAWPICAKRGIPMAVYVTTGIVDRTDPAWWYGLEEWIATRERIVCNLSGRLDVVETATLAEKESAYESIAMRLQRARPSERKAFYEDALAREGIDFARYSDDVAMTWDELRTLASEPLVTIGAHSISHCALSRLPHAEMRHEIAGSRSMLERQLKMPIQHFAFPYGDPSTVGTREFSACRKLGFTTATTTRHSMLASIDVHGLHQLPRIPTDPFESRQTLAVKLSGLPGRFKQLRDRLRGSATAGSLKTNADTTG
ncbi:MAG: polysaccharide deacetylase family protein [Planctomycetes bacterium]|nr:polysaccharide deacetylase family protein [Planctomycetota bacterium]MCB9919983.1 polysaccharide deacetylase family protein [Planctomycetota bacterium]